MQTTEEQRIFLLSKDEILQQGCSVIKSDLQKADHKPLGMANSITIFMCGDVMTGRGIDQLLPYPSDPEIHEPYMKNAIGYVEIAERVNGPIQKPVGFSYIWGDVIEELDRITPDIRMINLETSITKSDDYWKGKGINYRMHPKNIPCLTIAGINYCSLANNHVLDWGYSGLKETLEILKKLDVKFSGAGLNPKEAETPAVMEVKGKGRVIVFSFGTITSGIPIDWAARKDRAGVFLPKDLSNETVKYIQEKVHGIKRQRDIVIASIHWGANWGYMIPDKQRAFARKLIDNAGIDIIHGHSSHHVKGIEVYKGKLILYGCGDFINDYEGIGGGEDFRPDLTLMYFVSVDPSIGKLVHLQMIPMKIKRFTLNRASREDALWLWEILNREGIKVGTRIELREDNTLILQ